MRIDATEVTANEGDTLERIVWERYRLEGDAAWAQLAVVMNHERNEAVAELPLVLPAGTPVWCPELVTAEAPERTLRASELYD